MGQHLERGDPEALDDWLDVLILLVGLLPGLPDPLQQQVMQEILASAHNYGDASMQVWFLARLLPQVPKPFRNDVVAEVQRIVGIISDQESRMEAFLPAVPLLAETEWPETLIEKRDEIARVIGQVQARPPISQPETNRLKDTALSSALKEARSISSGYGNRAKLLRSVVPSLLNLPINDRFSLWCETLHDLATQRYRKDILSDIEVLGAVIQSLGGTTAIIKTCQAIVNTGKWIP